MKEIKPENAAQTKIPLEPEPKLTEILDDKGKGTKLFFFKNLTRNPEDSKFDWAN